MSAADDDELDPRVLRTRRVVLSAVLAELADAGYAGFTVESVAARAGVGKSTIYRHWQGRVDLVADALETMNVQPEPDPHGSSRERVEDLIDHLVRAMTDSPVAACVPALIEAAARDRGIGDLFYRYSANRRQALRDAIAQGVASDEFPPHVDPELAAQALAGAIFYRRVMTDAALTPDEIPRLITTVLG